MLTDVLQVSCEVVPIQYAGWSAAKKPLTVLHVAKSGMGIAMAVRQPTGIARSSTAASAIAASTPPSTPASERLTAKSAAADAHKPDTQSWPSGHWSAAFSMQLICTLSKLG